MTFISTSSRKKASCDCLWRGVQNKLPRFALSQELAVNGAGALIPQLLRHLRGNLRSSHRKSKYSSRIQRKVQLQSTFGSSRWVPRKSGQSGLMWVSALKTKQGSEWSGMVRDGVYHPERCQGLFCLRGKQNSPCVRFEIPLFWSIATHCHSDVDTIADL